MLLINVTDMGEVTLGPPIKYKRVKYLQLSSYSATTLVCNLAQTCYGFQSTEI